MQCSKCNRIFVSLKGLKRHKSSSACERAQKVTLFQKKYCTKYFSYRSGLSRHKKNFCKKKNDYNELQQIKTVSGKKRKKISIKPKSKINPLSGLTKSLASAITFVSVFTFSSNAALRGELNVYEIVQHELLKANRRRRDSIVAQITLGTCNNK